MSFAPSGIAGLIIASSFAAGLNIYATVLTLGILARTSWVELPPGLDSLGRTWVLVVCAIMFAVEFVADKIPGFDMIWNALHTVVRVPVAALVAYQASSHLSPQMQVASAIIGGLIALAAHSSKTAMRAAVTPSPEPVSNIALSTTEDALAVGLTWFATHHPYIAASMALILLATAALAARSVLKAIRRPLRRWLRLDVEQEAAAPKTRL